MVHCNFVKVMQEILNSSSTGVQPEKKQLTMSSRIRKSSMSVEDLGHLSPMLLEILVVVFVVVNSIGVVLVLMGKLNNVIPANQHMKLQAGLMKCLNFKLEMHQSCRSKVSTGSIAAGQM